MLALPTVWSVAAKVMVDMRLNFLTSERRIGGVDGTKNAKTVQSHDPRKLLQTCRGCKARHEPCLLIEKQSKVSSMAACPANYTAQNRLIRC